MKKIYCAGPLFNPKEQEEMAEIADALEKSGYAVFLPQRDGIELAKASQEIYDKGMSEHDANEELAKSIFIIDTHQVIKCDGLLLNMNGRVPDEGAMVEAGIAWALHKPIVIYKNDSRTILLGADNPLVVGLSAFQVANTMEEIVELFNNEFFGNKQEHLDWTHLDPDYIQYIDK